MKLLVVIVNYNGAPWMEKVREALRTEVKSLRGGGISMDLLVFDNGSGDGSDAAWEKGWPGVILRRSTENLGFAAGNNEGFRYALENGYDYVYLLNQDAWPGKEALRQLIAMMCLVPGYAVLSPVQQRAGGGYDPAFARDVVPKGRPDGPMGCIRQVPRVMAAHWLVSCEALRQVGLFEPLLPLYGQDDNWCDRAAFHGWKIGFVPEIAAVHDRAGRREPKDRIIYRNYYMGSLVRLLDIRRPLWERRLFVCLFTLVKTVKYGSLQPLKYHRSLRRKMKEIRAARETTRKPAAYV